jgi:uncharacterized damage-inducible protein DinB
LLAGSGWLVDATGGRRQDGSMPLFTRPVTDERDALVMFLEQQRESLRAAALDLSDEQARATPTVSSLSVGGLIKHCARTERRWTVAGIAGEPLPGLWPPEDWPADFRMEPDETLAELLSYYAKTAGTTDRIVAAVEDLGQPQAADPERSVRWVLLHLIKETARHAGHADIIREALDGQRAGALDEAYQSASP